MKATPATKTFEIQKKLVPYLDSNKVLSEFEFKMYEKEINSIPDYVGRNDTLGLLFAIQKKDALMEKHFENILSSTFNLTALFNYSLLLNHRSLFKKRKNLLYEYKEDLNASDLLNHLLDIATVYLDSDMVMFIYNKAKKIKCDEFYIDRIIQYKTNILEIRKMTNCSNSQIDLLVEICSGILRKYSQVSSSRLLETIAGGHYVFCVDTDDIDTLVDMNFELADRVSENPELDSCKLIAVFRPNIKAES